MMYVAASEVLKGDSVSTYRGFRRVTRVTTNRDTTVIEAGETTIMTRPTERLLIRNR